MGMCFSKEKYPEQAAGGEQEVEFKKREPSLSSSSDGQHVFPSWRLSAREIFKPKTMTIVNDKKVNRRESEVIKAAKENLKKSPGRSSLKIVGESARGEASSSDRPSTPETTGRFDSANSESEFSEGSSARGLLGSSSAKSADPLPPAAMAVNGMSTSSSLKPNRLKRNVSFCQEVILIQYSRQSSAG